MHSKSFFRVSPPSPRLRVESLAFPTPETRNPAEAGFQRDAVALRAQAFFFAGAAFFAAGAFTAAGAAFFTAATGFLVALCERALP